MATKILPAATQIVDYHHAREHVHDLAKQLADVLGEHGGRLATLYSRPCVSD